MMNNVLINVYMCVYSIRCSLLQVSGDGAFNFYFLILSLLLYAYLKRHKARGIEVYRKARL